MTCAAVYVVLLLSSNWTQSSMLSKYLTIGKEESIRSFIHWFLDLMSNVMISCINWADAWVDCGTWLWGIRCIYSSNTWEMCLLRHWWLDYWVPNPLFPYSHRFFVLHSIEVVGSLGRMLWRSVVLWGILPGQSGWSTTWSWGWCRLSASLLFQCKRVGAIWFPDFIFTNERFRHSFVLFILH